LDKFKIDPAILAGSHALVSLKLCDARLQDDARFPWIVLVPRRIGARELDHLRNGDRAQLIEEMILAGGAARAIGAAMGRPVDKINSASLGNVTPQLHAHVVGRRTDDDCWPHPVWGWGEPKTYNVVTLKLAIEAARGILAAAASLGG
jgi:diadenosine tetraphosphate (Ap4A) HIT family hydrolase